MQFFKKVLFQLTHEMRRRPKLEAGFHVADHYALFFKIAVSLSRVKNKTLTPFHGLPPWTAHMDYRLRLVIRVTILSESSLRSVSPV